MSEAKTEESPAPDVEEASGAESFSNWEFVDRVPTLEEVRDLLAELPDCYGLEYVDYLEYVQGLPQTKKIVKKVPMPNGSVRKEDEYHDVVTLYMSVAGRVKMANDIALNQGWRLDFEPEPMTPTGVPGYVSLEQRIVYREYAVFTRLKDSDQEFVDPEYQVLLGRKPGTAWVPFTGGKQAAGSNPYEKVETSARGRALAAWGIGVLPGSGIASLEEMLGAKANERAMQAEAGGQRGGRQSANSDRVPREEMIERVLTVAEQVRQMRRITEEDMRDKIGVFLGQNLGIASVYDEEAHQVDWQKVKDGQLVLMYNSLSDTLRDLQNQEQPL